MVDQAGEGHWCDDAWPLAAVMCLDDRDENQHDNR
jgi:hypothetical protein